jgi:tRNA A37 threonylcarbamoyladenosine synthetase subunit TsaC/SUA5/YrdC
VASKGYMGHDEFAVVESVLVQRFPVYHATDTNAKPTWGARQLQYKLVPGQTGWILKVDKEVEYWLYSRTKGSGLAMPNPSLQCAAFGRR